jgi:hypothetical protein
MALGPDIHPANTYEAVGRAISGWERAEMELALLYAIFVGKPDDLDVIVDYGKLHRIFNNRMDALRTEPPTRFFKRTPPRTGRANGLQSILLRENWPTRDIKSHMES